MLIRWATEHDIPMWYALATEMSEIFQHPADMGAELKSKSSGKGTSRKIRNADRCGLYER